MRHFLGVLLNKSLAWVYLIPHEGREDIVSFDGILDVHLQQRAPCRIHGGVPQLRGVHLAEALVTLNVQVFSTRRVHRLQEFWKVTGDVFDLTATQEIRWCT